MRMEEIYDNWLDELPLEFTHCKPSTSDIVKHFDPTMYRCGFNDFADGYTPFTCDDCGEEFTDTGHLCMEDDCICAECAEKEEATA